MRAFLTELAESRSGGPPNSVKRWLFLRPRLILYGIALVAVALVWLARIVLAPVLGDQSPYLLFVPAVLVAAGLGGWGPGLMATALGALLGLTVNPAGSQIMHDHTVERCTWVDIPKILVDHARLRDLCIFPFNTADESQLSLVEALIFESGRPVLLLPEGATRQLSASLEVAAVAWDHSRSATRAVADALPLLQAAKRVHVLPKARRTLGSASLARFRSADA